MKILRLFDSLKFVVVAIVCTFILNVAHADTTAIQSVIAYGKTEQSGTPTPTNPVPIMTNNGVLTASKNLFDDSLFDTASAGIGYHSFSIPNGTYTMSTNFPATPAGITNVFIFAGRVSSGASSPNNGVSANVPRTITVTNGYYTVAYRSGGSGAGNNNDPKNFNWMLSNGSTATAYEPYGGIVANGLTETIRDAAGHKATAEMLLGLNDQYRDEQNINTGAITRKVGVKVLNGTENWEYSVALLSYMYSLRIDDLYAESSNVTSGRKTPYCTHFERSEQWRMSDSTSRNNRIQAYQPGSGSAAIGLGYNYPSAAGLDDFKAWLADQYANGTPVIVVYPLKASAQTTENVATQSLTTAPVRQTLGAIMNMPIKTILTDNTEIMSGANELIKIATTKYNEESFEDVQDALTGVFNAVDNVVTQTMSQAQAIDTIATTKQTRPDEGCPRFKKCLLVEDEDGTPHWYEIYDPINDFLRPILAAAEMSGNQGAPVMTTHTSGSDTIYDTYNGFYNGSGAFRKKYIDNTASAADRPFGPTTLARCADNATRTTSTVGAGLCYNTGGMFRELTEGSDDDAGEWALVWNGNEGGENLGITPGVVYGVAKCTSVGQHTTEITGDVQSGSEYWWPKKLNNYATSNPTTLASLIEQYPNSNVETVFNTLPSEYGTDEKPGYPRDNFMNCWCKMTAIGVPGSGDTPDQRYANGTIMSVGGGWVFDGSFTSAANCANNCAYNCAYRVRAHAAFRRAVLTVK